MKKPIIFCVDDDEQVLSALTRDLKQKYRSGYRIISTTSAKEALENLILIKKKGDHIALFVSDQRMPEMLGVEFLEQAKAIFPLTKRVLLTAYSDIQAAIKAINDVQLDYYLSKPWDPPEEKLYPILDEMLDNWHLEKTPDLSGVKVIGYQYSPKSHKIKDFLSGNLFPYKWIDIEKSDLIDDLKQTYQLSLDTFPIVVLEDGTVLEDPSLTKLGEHIGLTTQASQTLYDVAIIGAGPAGLAAAVYGGSEGLNTLLIEKRAPGGQAGTSSRIENYLGFPKGLSGAELSRRAITQATRFGVELLSPQQVEKIETTGEYKTIHLADSTTLQCKSIVISTGVDYRRLEAPGLQEYTGAGVYYGAATTEANACQDRQIFVVGGGNSAGQGAVYLSSFAKKVTILIRKPDLSATMSSYLIDQINSIENIEVKGFHQITEAFGENERLNSLELENTQTKERFKTHADSVFIFIGAKPFTDWLDKDFIRDSRGFVITGRDLQSHDAFNKNWKRQREPYLLETSIAGIFAAGDVRSGAMNRVASATGEGAMSISMVHKYLSET